MSTTKTQWKPTDALETAPDSRAAKRSSRSSKFFSAFRATRKTIAAPPPLTVLPSRTDDVRYDVLYTPSGPYIAPIPRTPRVYSVAENTPTRKSTGDLLAHTRSRSGLPARSDSLSRNRKTPSLESFASSTPSTPSTAGPLTPPLPHHAVLTPDIAPVDTRTVDLHVDTDAPEERVSLWLQEYCSRFPKDKPRDPPARELTSPISPVDSDSTHLSDYFGAETAAQWPLPPACSSPPCTPPAVEELPAPVRRRQTGCRRGEGGWRMARVFDAHHPALSALCQGDEPPAFLVDDPTPTPTPTPTLPAPPRSKLPEPSSFLDMDAEPPVQPRAVITKRPMKRASMPRLRAPLSH